MCIPVSKKVVLKNRLANQVADTCCSVPDHGKKCEFYFKTGVKQL